MATIPLLPCGGMDNVHAASHGVFQPRQVNGQPAPPERVQVAVDLDIDSDGAVSTRPGTVAVHTTTVPVGLWTVGGRSLWQSAGTLYEGSTARVTGLSQRVVLGEHGGSLFGTDGSKHFVLSGDAMIPWGLPVPEITVTAIPGMLAAGRYLVQASFVDAAGNEGGVSDLAAVDLADGQSLCVIHVADPLAVLIRFYAGGVNAKHTSFVAEFPANAGRYVLHDVRTTAALPPVTEQMRGPISRAAGIASFRAFLLMWRDNAVFRSEGAEPHLFHPDNIMQFPGTVTACVGLDTGLWVGTEVGLFWVSGEGPEAWIPRQESLAAVLPGSLRLSGAKLPSIQQAGQVALFVSNAGLLVGTTSGTALTLVHDHYVFDSGSRASLAYVEREAVRQLVICVGD
jgi:hypothetical protein